MGSAWHTQIKVLMEKRGRQVRAESTQAQHSSIQAEPLGEKASQQLTWEKLLGSQRNHKSI